MKRWQIIALIALGIVIIGGAGYLGYQGPSSQQRIQVTAPPTVTVTHGEVKQSIISPGRLVNYRTVELPAGTNGSVTNLNAQAGDVVEAGDMLLRFGDGQEQQSALANAEVALLDAQQAYDDLYTQAPLKEAEALQAIASAEQDVIDAQYRVSSLDTPASEASIAAAESDVVLAAQALETAERNYAPYENKPDGNLNKAHTQAAWADAQQAYDRTIQVLNNLIGTPSDITRVEVEEQLVIAEAQLDIAEAAYEQLEDGVDPDEAASAEADVRKAEVDVTQAEAELDAVELQAPFDGIVLEVKVREGEAVAKGESAIVLADPLALEVLTSVVEEDYALITPGQQVELFFDAQPDVTITGEVDRIIPKRSSDERPLYQVYVALDDIPPGLVEGMTADAAIVLEARTNVLRLPRALANASSDGTAQITLWVNGQEVQRMIQIGLRGDLFVEIIDGLLLSDAVIGQ